MGLEFADLILTLERDYDIAIDDHELASVRTVRELWTVVAPKAGLQPLLWGPEWDRFRELVADKFGLPDVLVMADSSIVSGMLFQ